MGAIWGKNIKVTISGESHGKAMGLTIDGLPPGIELNMPYINDQLQRRAPGKSKLSTTRRERDAFEILSGYFHNKTTGTPLHFIIWNTDQQSKDYEPLRHIMRPGHGDYTGYMKYKGFHDYRGGGHFSGRLTAPLVLAGAIGKDILRKRDIIIGSHIKSILDIEDISFHSTYIENSLLHTLEKMDFPVLDGKQAVKMQETIIKAKSEMDSVGGIVESALINVPVGIGSPFFDSLESTLAHLLFAIPGVKGVEFGTGFEIARKRGSQVKDEYVVEEGHIKTLANHNGGILGGISTGMPILFRTAIKPTSSIGQRQRTVDMGKMENTEIQITGRHDPCIVPRAVPVIEAVAALGVLDLMVEEEGVEWMT